MKLTTEQEAWLQALESGKYNQNFGGLHIANGFCCLGVACELSKDILTTSKVIGEINSYNGKTQVLPEIMIEKLSLRDNCGVFASSVEQVNPDIEGETITYDTLTELNDSGNWSFKEIAAYIRANPENVFTKGAD